MCIRRSTVPLTIAAALIACSANIAFGQSTVTIPASSIAKPSDAGVRSHTNIQIGAMHGGGTRQPNGGPPFAGLFYEDPASLACVYSLISPPPRDQGCNPNDLTLNNPTGGSLAIAIVDAYDNPNALSDLIAFSVQFGVPPATKFSVVYAPAGAQPGFGQCSAGPGTQPGQDPTGGWEIEESLDVQYAHGMAPQATLYLVEAQSNNDIDLYCAVSIASSLVAKAGGGEVSMSFGSGEFSGETLFDSVFTTPKVVYFASSGDSPGVSYPAASPNVVSVGGTSTDRDPVSGSFLLESVWQVAGGGPSALEPRPTYQNHIQNVVGNSRGTPDMVLDANPNTGVWVLDDFVIPEYGTTLCGASGVPPTPCWLIVGGTSVSSPTLAGIVNAAGNFAASGTAELNTLYGDPESDFNNIKTGSCGPYMGYSASNNWGFCTGLGSPNGYINQPRNGPTPSPFQ